MAGRCELNPQDCSLGLQLQDGGATLVPPCHGAFGFAWSGARGAVGVCGGRHRFSVTVLQELPPAAAAAATLAAIPELDAAPGVRVGVSCASTDVAMLGESATSWAYSSLGKKCGGGGGFLPYGVRFGVGDEVISLFHMCVACSATPVRRL